MPCWFSAFCAVDSIAACRMPHASASRVTPSTRMRKDGFDCASAAAAGASNRTITTLTPNCMSVAHRGDLRGGVAHHLLARFAVLLLARALPRRVHLCRLLAHLLALLAVGVEADGTLAFAAGAQVRVADLRVVRPARPGALDVHEHGLAFALDGDGAGALLAHALH